MTQIRYKALNSEKNIKQLHIYRDLSSWSYVSFLQAHLPEQYPVQVSLVQLEKHDVVCVVLLIWEICIIESLL